MKTALRLSSAQMVLRFVFQKTSVLRWRRDTKRTRLFEHSDQVNLCNPNWKTDVAEGWFLINVLPVDASHLGGVRTRPQNQSEWTNTDAI